MVPPAQVLVCSFQSPPTAPPGSKMLHQEMLLWSQQPETPKAPGHSAGLGLGSWSSRPKAGHFFPKTGFFPWKLFVQQYPEILLLYPAPRILEGMQFSMSGGCNKGSVTAAPQVTVGDTPGMLLKLRLSPSLPPPGAGSAICQHQSTLPNLIPIKVTGLGFFFFF